jgi:hypothetical protein
MFKREKVGEDILFEMEKNLQKNAFIAETQKTNQRIEAIELLTKAANNFETVGKTKEAEAITRIVEFVATKKPEKKAEMTPEQQVENLEETGTQWPRDAFNAIDGDPQDEEDKLYQEYMNDPDIAAEIRVSEEDDGDQLNNQEIAALAKLWG